MNTSGNLYRERAELNKRFAELQLKINDLEQAEIDRIKGMNKAERMKLAFTYPELTAGHMDLLYDDQFAFMTGSTVYSPYPGRAKDVDYVILIHPQAFNGYAVGANMSDYWEEDGMDTLYAHRKGILYNIICVGDPELFKAWRETTDIMRSLMVNCSALGFERKWARVRVFRALRDVLWPVEQKPTFAQLDHHDAVSLHKCRLCKREAINFTCKPAREYWENTGICERCAEQKDPNFLNGEENS